MSHLVLVIVRDLDIVGITIDKPEADSPLIVNADRLLSHAVPFELVEPIAGRNLKVIYTRCQVDVLELPPRPPTDVRREPFRPAGCVKFLRMSVCEGLDHTSIVTRHVTIVNTRTKFV